MRRALCLALALPFAHAPMVAAETRQLDAHEHGTGELNIAIEGNSVVMEFEAPGFDIVGFEYEASTDDDKAKIASAIETLSSPLALFAVSDAAGCAVTAAKASLVEEHQDHDNDPDHEESHDQDEKDDDHANEKGQDHDEKDDDHDHEDEHDHENEAGHTAFHAEYELTCDTPSNLTGIDLPYFQTFRDAEKLVVQIVNDAGASAHDATREAPSIRF